MEDAADQAVHVVQDVAVTVALVCCAAITALAAIAVGLVALAQWVADLYRPVRRARRGRRRSASGDSDVLAVVGGEAAAVGAARGSAVGGQAVGDTMPTPRERFTPHKPNLRRLVG